MSNNFVCGLCGSRLGESICEQRSLDLDYQKYADHLAEKHTQYFVCLSCGTVSQVPLPAPEVLDHYYASVPNPQSHQDVLAEYKVPLYTERIQFLQRLTGLTGGSALEVGSASGTFLKMLQDRMGMKVLGIEPSPGNAVEASKALDNDNVPIIRVSFENVDIKSQGLLEVFDLAISMNVLEHVRNPRQFLEAIVATIRHGGFLYLEVPSTEYLANAAKVSSGQNIHPVHLSHFLGAGIATALNGLGMVVIHAASTMSFDNPTLQVLSRKYDQSELGRESFLKQVAQIDARFAEAANRLQRALASSGHAVLWGAGTDLYEIFVRYPAMARRERYTLVDQNPAKQGKSLLGVPIQSPNVLVPSEVDSVVVTASNLSIRLDIRSDIQKQLTDVRCVDLFPLE